MFFIGTAALPLRIDNYTDDVTPESASMTERRRMEMPANVITAIQICCSFAVYTQSTSLQLIKTQQIISLRHRNTNRHPDCETAIRMPVKCICCQFKKYF